ncbi:MAG: hypothetical protein KME19_06710 [Microcoleus vaginatus WJT46-NPBG5]|nr:hypothetical protein [Microcoleus vaginatus WJT46-NPBG5]
MLVWVLGDRSAKTFAKLCKIIKCCKSYFYVTDRYSVYPCFIDDEDHILSKTYMTRVEGENTRLRHYLACLIVEHYVIPKKEMLKHSIKLLLYYLHDGFVTLPG